MFVYRVTHRHYYDKNHAADGTIGFYSTLEKAHLCVTGILGDDAECEDDFGFEIWTSKYLPNTEYFVEKIRVY